MAGRFNNHPLTSEPDDFDNSPENSGSSPPSNMFNDSKITSTSSPRKSGRRSLQKRVVSVPIRDVEGSRLKGETSVPPSDSWAWRKYGQKPIKGSPYPRGYYRCSSSKGCPAKKQVEKSHVDPTMLIVTYSSEHNHPRPATRNNNHHHHNRPQTPPKTTSPTIETGAPTNDPWFCKEKSKIDADEKFANLEEENPDINGGFGWFSELESTSSTMLESPIFTDDRITDTDADTTRTFSMREEDELLFADLGELPEYSRVFQRGAMEREEERRQCTLRPWFGTTG